MKTELKIYTVEQICDGFDYNENSKVRAFMAWLASW